MKLLVTYTNGKTETHIGVESITPVKHADGKLSHIVVESFLRCSALWPKRPTEIRGIEKMELFF